jgi:hypothetical protein
MARTPTEEQNRGATNPQQWFCGLVFVRLSVLEHLLRARWPPHPAMSSSSTGPLRRGKGSGGKGRRPPPEPRKQHLKNQLTSQQEKRRRATRLRTEKEAQSSFDADMLVYAEADVGSLSEESDSTNDYEVLHDEATSEEDEESATDSAKEAAYLEVREGRFVRECAAVSWDHLGKGKRHRQLLREPAVPTPAAAAARDDTDSGSCCEKEAAPSEHSSDRAFIDDEEERADTDTEEVAETLCNNLIPLIKKRQFHIDKVKVLNQRILAAWPAPAATKCDVDSGAPSVTWGDTGGTS